MERTSRGERCCGRAGRGPAEGPARLFHDGDKVHDKVDDQVCKGARPWPDVNGSGVLLLPVHARRNFETQPIQSDKTSSIILVIGFGGIGFHGGDLRLIQADR